MIIHGMKLATAPFNQIVSGNKVIESRLYDEKRQQINLGDQIEFVCSDDPTKKILTIVRALYQYQNFENMFSDFRSSYFGGSSKDELLREIETFYSKEDQDKYGVVGIKIDVLK
jgi:ASC-1-like (ASCH) protein